MGIFCVEHEELLEAPDDGSEPGLEPDLRDAALDPVP